MEKISLEMMFDAMKLREHKEKIYKIIDRVDEDIREELRKYLQGGN